ncbi:MAG: DUF3494 domain-containing protein [Rhodoferax sp.]|nr:DUF3494 domain-containing protein [Rhodoferax sp.]
MKITPLIWPLLLGMCGAASHAADTFLAPELASFAVLSASATTNTNATVLKGNLGVSNNSSITGITGFFGTLANDGPGLAYGSVHQGDSFSSLADFQLNSAKSSLSLLGPGTTLGVDLTGLTLAPGIYTVSAGTSNLTGAVTLDGGGNANAFWVFQMPSTLITSSSSAINLLNTGSGAGVYWNVGSSATLGANSNFAGNVLAQASVTMNSGVNLGCGRALAHTGAVTMIGDTVNAGDCLGTAAAGSFGLSGGLSVSEIGGLPTALAFSPVSPVPETLTYLMLLAGVGLIGLVIQLRPAFGASAFPTSGQAA